MNRNRAGVVVATGSPSKENRLDLAVVEAAEGTAESEEKQWEDSGVLGEG